MDKPDLARDVLALAKQKSLQIATAESCTGGLLAAALTDIPGASTVFDRGFVTYSNAAKQDMLDVFVATLANHGAVSEPVAAEMALGALANSSADLALSITGIAGPGGSESKPEGRVCFALATRSGLVLVETVEFGAIGRTQVRQRAVSHALTRLMRQLEIG